MDLSVGALRLASRLSRVVPVPVGRTVATSLGRLAVTLSGDQRLIAERNMRRVLGPNATEAQLRRAVRGVFASYGRYWFDTLRLPALPPAEVADGMTVEGLHHVTEAVDRGVGPILALPHVGGWEWAGRYLGTELGWRVTAVAEKLEPPELYEWFLGLRAELGMRIIPLGPTAGSESAKALADGDVMCLLCDRDLAGSGIEVEFFGERTTLPGGPALMALRSGSPLLPTAVYFRGRRCHGVVEPPLDTERRGRLRDDVQRVTQDLAHALERLIRVAPEQWHLLQPNWPSDLEALGRAPEQPDGPEQPAGTGRLDGPGRAGGTANGSQPADGAEGRPVGSR
jgi:lauroyl/myristoyl acyltransferase